MAISMFDQQLFEFSCDCGERTEIVLSQLDHMAAVTCPACGSTADLGAEPYRSLIEQLRDTAAELDKQARQRGEIIKRIS